MPKQAIVRSNTSHDPLEAVLTPQARALVIVAVEAHQAAMDGLIAFLDAADNDSDLEDGGDAEDDPDQEEDAADDEPSLGSLECVGYIPADSAGGPGFDQTRWSMGDGTDLEDEHDGREPDDEMNQQPARLDTIAPHKDNSKRAAPRYIGSASPIFTQHSPASRRTDR